MELPPLATFLDTLPNGLRLVTVELPHLHTAALCAFVRVGSRFESPQDNGLSHFLEHMLFRGTRRLPSAYLLNHAVEALGGTLYAETRRDASLYQVVLPPETIGEGLHLLGEVLTQPALTEIEVERRIILEEMNEDLDEKGQDVHLGDLVCGAAWAGHPLGQKITGTLANVQRFGEDDLHRHFASFYGAQGIVLCAAGAVKRDEVRALAERAFADLPAIPLPEVLAPPPHDDGPRRVHRDGDAGTQTSLSLCFRSAGELDPDFPALVVLSRLLDDGMSTRLYQRLVNELGLAYYVGAGLDSMVDTGLFEMEATATHASVPRLVKEMLGLCAALRDEPVSQDELDKVRRRYRWDLLAIFDDPAALAEAFGRTELYYRPLGLAARLQRVQAVTPEDLQRVARRVLHPKNLSLASVGRMSGKIKTAAQAVIGDYARSWE